MNNPVARLRLIGTLGLATLLSLPAVGEAAPFTITSTLTGDLRPDNPDNLNILVTINGDDTSNEVSWVVDLQMGATHPGASLHEFYFNMAGVTGDYAFSDFAPLDWTVTGLNTNAQGLGGASFMFEVADDAGPPNTSVTNAIDLTFTMTKLVGGNFTVNDFLLAATSCGNEVANWCGQLGAHIGSLNALPGQSDSGFALGDFQTNQVPEPVSLVLFGTAGLYYAARRFTRG